MSSEVVCIGGASIDITIDIANSENIFGNQINFVDDIVTCAGGDALNEALTLAKLGHRTSLITCVGNDVLGRMLLSEIEKDGVDATYLFVDPLCSTSGIICLIGKDDKRNFLFKKYNAANRLDLDCVNMEAVKNAKVMTFGSFLFCDGFQEKSLIALFQTAKENNVITVADIAVMDETKDNLGAIGNVLPYVDYIFPNYDEAAAVTGKKNPEEIVDTFLDLGVGNVILKLGADGCLAKGKSGIERIYSYKVPVVNTTGAGDNFLAGFVSGILQERSLKECLIRASATAALTIQSMGASTGVQNMEQVKQFIREHGTPKFEKEEQE